MKWIKYLFFMVTVVCFAVSVFWAVQIIEGYRDGRKLYEEIAEEYVHRQRQDPAVKENEEMEGAASGHDDQKQEAATETNLLNKLPENAPDQKQIDFAGLLSENQDVIGWIDLPAVNISYPVVQGKDNDFYLHHALNREYLYAGSIFMDYQCSPNLKDYHTILYGHNMRDGSMFAVLKNLSDQRVLEQCPYFWFYQQDRNYLYQIFSVFQSRSGSETYMIRFKDDDTVEQWRQEIQKASVVENSIKLDEDSRIMTLSTCTGNGDIRWVVMGKLVWDGPASEIHTTAE